MTLKRLILSLPLLYSFAFAQQSENYFQQKTDYTIQVRLDDVRHVLHAFESIKYTNNSPDTLREIWFHLWPNAYKNNQTALAKQLREEGKLILEYPRKGDNGWIDSLSFKVDDHPVAFEYHKYHQDICKLILQKPLLPNSSVTITTPFRVQLPSASISRLGHIGQAYAITQWYPKPAVYDINGWNAMPYLDQGEFYSEWGSFDVRITLPSNYVVGATGELENGEEEIKWLNQKVKQTFNKIDYRLKNKNVKGAIVDSLAFPPSSAATKTLRYKQSNVHDFAWFADKRFNVLKGIVTLPHNKRDVTCWAMFTDNDFDLWTRAVEYLSDAVFFYSLWNGDYQYGQVTAVDGTISAGGGMEYPNITIIGEASNDFELETVIMHEVGHNWFYGMLGSNERQHAWMDEGINSFNELRYMRHKYPNATVGAILGRDSTENIFGISRFKNSWQYYFLYAKSARENKDQPLSLHSAEFSGANYGAMVYSKTALIFDYLYHYIGEEKFDEAMKFYFDRYKFKHPYPHNLRQTLEYYSGKNLSWMFDELITTTGKLDYAIKDFRKKGGSYEVLIKNTGDIHGPVLIGGLSNGKMKGVIWYDGFEGEKWLGFPASEIDELVIDPWLCMPEINRKNNRLKMNGLFKKSEPFEMKFLGMLDDPKKTQLFILPVLGYNEYNGLMPGLYLHNYLVFEKKFEFDLLPMIGLENLQFAGLADMHLNFHPDKGLQTFQPGLKFKRFTYIDHPSEANYSRVENYYDIEFKKRNRRSAITNKLQLRAIGVYEDPNTDFFTLYNNNIKTFADLTFKHGNKRAINPYQFTLTAQAGGDEIQDGRFVKATAEFKFHWTMSRRNNGFDFRVFGGIMDDTNSGIDARFRMGGTRNDKDYSYEYLYFARNQDEGLNGQIYVENDGAFKTRMFAGQSNRWLAALNIKSPKLGKVLGLFADFGTCDTDGLVGNDKLFYDFGVNIDLIDEAFNIYIPLGYSKSIQAGVDANKWNFLQRIMINLRLDKMHPKRHAQNVISF